MKYLVKFFVVTFLFLVGTYASAEQKTAFLDMKYILNSSTAGKAAQDYLKKTFSENQKKFTDQENELKKEERDLISKKDSVTKEEYKKKAEKLREKAKKYQTNRRDALAKIAKQRADARQKLIDKLEPIIQKYIEENGISIVIDSKNVVIGNTQLDITKVITEKLNKEFPSLKLN